MIATLEFNLPEELTEFKHSVNGTKYSCDIDTFANFLRSERKYGTLTEVEHEYLEKVIGRFYEVFPNMESDTL